MTFSVNYNYWVNRDGTRVYREYKDSTMNRFLIINIRSDGSKFIKSKNKGELELDQVIADSFKPKPKDWRSYERIYIDAYKGNCNVSNLFWKRIPKYSATELKRKHYLSLFVTSDGEVFDGKGLLHLVTVIGDADTNRMVAIEPYVRYTRTNRWGKREEKPVDVDDLMAETEFVNGDELTMKNPGVLHKDMNYLNYKANNLEWVEKDDPRYIAYCQKKWADIDQRTIDENPEHPNPLMKY